MTPEHTITPTLKELTEELARVKAALRLVEWGDYNRFARETCCANCGELSSEGHLEDCAVGEALK